MPGTPDVSRRTFLLGAAGALTAVPGAAAPGAAAPGEDAGGAARRGATRAASDSALLELSAFQSVARMSRGDITAERYATALIERCKASASLNAFITFEPDRVLEDARARDRERAKGAKPGALFGLPIPVKDSVNTADYRTTAGTPGLRDFRPHADAPIVRALKDAGAIVLGKTNLHELSFGWTSNNFAFGAVHNPYDTTRVPGGSSGGTAAAVAARLAPLGVAEDTEGSIRVPAACCGLVGLRPTTGRYSTAGCVPITPLFDQTGPLARSVRDAALFDSVAANDWRPLQPATLPGLRLGVIRDYFFTDLDPEIAALTEAALARLRDAGVVIVEATMPGLQRLIELTTDPVQNHDVRIALAQYLDTYHAGIDVEQLVAQASSDIREAFRSAVFPGAAQFVTAEQYSAARFTHLPALRRLYRDCFAQTNVAGIVFPTMLVQAPPIGMDTTVTAADASWPIEIALARNIAPASTAGIPGLVLPIGMTQSGLPFTIEIDAPAHSDRALLGLGAALEPLFEPLPPPRA